MATKAHKPHALAKDFTRILCISAHPDDNEFTIAGSVARWAREGREVVFCLVVLLASGPRPGRATMVSIIQSGRGTGPMTPRQPALTHQVPTPDR